MAAAASERPLRGQVANRLALGGGDHRADADEGTARDPVEGPPEAPQGRREPAGRPGKHHLVSELDRGKGAGEDRELQPERDARLHELRQEGREENQGLGI